MSRRVGLLIGRFSGYHKEHHEHIKRAIQENDKVVILVGSANRRKSIKNPFDFEQRRDCILRNIREEGDVAHMNVEVYPLNDHPDDKKWKEGATHYVNRYAAGNEFVTLYGSEKDASSYYIGLFPEYKKSLSVPSSDANATKIREDYFNVHQSMHLLAHNEWLSNSTKRWLGEQKFDESLQAEWEFYKAEKVKFSHYPYPETLNFNCADAVMVWNDEVAMVERKFAPGKGCLAIAGGFKNNNETYLQAAIREAFEETKVDASREEMLRSLVATRIFDSPNRSLGIPRITMAALFDFSWMPEKPKMFADDDAANIVWVKIRDVLSMRNIYDDHADIIYLMSQYLKGK